jgi:hypothetical protein
MRVNDLVGSNVLVKIQYAGEQAGRITAIKKEYESPEIERSVNLTLFSVVFDDGSTADVVGQYFSRIDNRDYIEASTERPTVF